MQSPRSARLLGDKVHLIANGSSAEQLLFWDLSIRTSDRFLPGRPKSRRHMYSGRRSSSENRCTAAKTCIGGLLHCDTTYELGPVPSDARTRRTLSDCYTERTKRAVETSRSALRYRLTARYGCSEKRLNVGPTCGRLVGREQCTDRRLPSAHTHFLSSRSELG
jgi:hypothetical protein